MQKDYDSLKNVYEGVGQDPRIFSDKTVAHLMVQENRVLGVNLVDGLDAETEALPDGVRVKLHVKPNTVIEKQVHMCFGVIPEEGRQRIELDVEVGDQSAVDILAHCAFPNAVDVEHLMNADIRLRPGAAYRYFERHIHGAEGGVRVVPKARVHLDEYSRFETEFELIKGRVGHIDVDYETWGQANSSMQMMARIAGRANDTIALREVGHLDGEAAAGALLSRIAVSENASADIYNELTATAPYARGHVDCKEIIQDEAKAKAVPVVDVRHPLARVTHEAALGSVDSKQLETLMVRGMDEEEAVEMIVQGMLQAGQ